MAENLTPVEAPPWASQVEGGLTPVEAPPWADKVSPPERGVLERAGQAASETAGEGVEAAKKMVVPPSKDEAKNYLGPSGMWRSFKETGAGILSPFTATVGAATAGGESLAASGLGAAQRGLESGISKGVGAVNPEAGAALEKNIPTSEQAYESARPYVSAATSSLRSGPPIPSAELATGFKSPKYKVPTMPDLEKEGTRLYQHPAVKDVRISPDAVHRELGNLKTDVGQLVDPELMPGTWSKLNKAHGEYAPTSTDPMAALTKVKPATKAEATIDDIDTLRKQLRDVAKDYSQSRKGEDRMAANVAIGRIDDFLANLKQPDLLAGDAVTANKVLLAARDNWAAMRRVETADKKIASALLRAGSTWSGHNIENTLRQNIRRIIDPDSAVAKRLRMGWSPLELARAEDIVKGSHISNALREVGNRLSGNMGMGGSAILATELALRGHFKEAAAVGALSPIGMGMKALGNRRTYKAARALSEQLASRSPLARKWKRQGTPVSALPEAVIGGAAATVPEEKRGGRIDTKKAARRVLRRVKGS